MKKRILALALAFAMLVCLLAGCQEETLSATANYKVTVIGLDGKPMTSGVVVKFMQNGVQKAMQTVDANGIAAKELPRGDYQVELQFTKADVKHDYDKANATLTATKTQIQVELYNFAPTDPRYLNAKITSAWPFTLILDAYGIIRHISPEHLTTAEELQGCIDRVIAETPKTAPKAQEGKGLENKCYGYDLSVIAGTDTATINPAKTEKPTVIMFWGAWSEHCKTALETLNTVASENADVAVVAVHSFRDADKAPAYIQENFSASSVIFAQDYAEDGYHTLLGGAEENMKMFAAYQVSAGKTPVTLSQGDRSFFVFAPTESGIYEISYTGDLEFLGQYGAPSFVNHTDSGVRVEGKENVISLEIMPGMIGSGETGTAEYVYGLDAADGTNSGILNIIRVGDYVPEQWIAYTNVSTLEKYTLPENANIHEFNMNQSYDVVFNSQDGLYHLNSADGPLVMVRLGKNAEQFCKYLSPFQVVAELSNPFFTVKFDANGEVTERMNYGSALVAYFDVIHEPSGLYPMTQDLYTIIREVGTYIGWWDYSSPSYLFYDEMNNKITINTETGWLFNCCYID